MAAKKKKKARKKVGQKASKKAPAKRDSKPAKRVASSAAEDEPATSGKVAEIKAIIDVMLAAGAVEVETDDGHGGRLRVRLKEDQLIAARPTMVAVPEAKVADPVASALPVPVAGSSSEAEAPSDSTEAITSPMVGTFYRAPSPEAETFVEVGDSFGEDSTICIIEAMKVMNEIKAESIGRIVEILVENGEPVEYGQPLFRVARD